MMRIRLMIALWGIFISLSFSSSGVIIKSGTPLFQKNLTILFQNDNSFWYYLHNKDELQKTSSLSKQFIEVFEDDSVFALNNEINDPYFNQQWGMKSIGLNTLISPKLSQIQKEWRKQAKIYIVDSGAPADWNNLITHPDLINLSPGILTNNSRFIVGSNHAKVYQLVDSCGCGVEDTVYVEWQNKHWDEIGHSTHVSGIAAANGNNNIGVAGVDWASEVTYVKVLRDGTGWGRMSWVIFALLDADKESEERGMDIVVNLSLGSVFPYRPLEELIGYLDQKRDMLGYGVTLVCAAGNNGVESSVYPAMYSHRGNIKIDGYKNVISVGAVILDEKGNYTRADYSNYGEDVDIWAPGGTTPEWYYDEVTSSWRVNYDSLSIFNLAPDSVDERPFYPHWYAPLDHPYDYFRLSGTSMATPHVTGAIARFLDYYGKGYNLQKLKARLKNTGKIFSYKGNVEEGIEDLFDDKLFYGRVLYLPSFWKKINENKFISVDYSIKQNFPNPFNPSTKISYEIFNPGFVKLLIYDILGREIEVLENNYKEAGVYTADFDGSSLASGTYFYKLEFNGENSVTKMTLIK